MEGVERRAQDRTRHTKVNGEQPTYLHMYLSLIGNVTFTECKLC